MQFSIINSSDVTHVRTRILHLNGIRYLQSRSFPKIIDIITFSLSSAQLERSVISVKEIGQIFPVSKGKWV